MKINPFRTCLAASATGLLALATVLPARADYPSTVLFYNPAAYWRLNETTPVPVDVATNSGSLGSAANGVYLGQGGTTYLSTSGALAASSDGAVAFVGDPVFPGYGGNQYSGGLVEVPYSASLNTKVFSAECWVRPDDNIINYLTVVGAFTTPTIAPRHGWWLYGNTTSWNLRLYNSTGGSLTAIASVAPVVGQWQHLVVTCDGTNGILYINGVPGVTNVQTDFVANGGPILFGARFDGYSCPSSIDEVALYTNVLSAGTVAAHYSAGTNSTVDNYFTTVNNDKPVAYYHLDNSIAAPTLPVASNSGSLGATAQGTYGQVVTTASTGPSYDGLGGATVSAFNGLRGSVNCGINVQDLSAGLNSMTIVAWAKFSATRTMAWQALITCGDSSWALQRRDNDQAIGFRLGGTDLWTTGARPINDGKWHHIAATYDGAQQRIYLDGTLEISGNKTGDSGGESTYPIVIGDNGKYPGSRVFNGSIADVAVFTNALSASDVYAVYNASWIAPTVLTPAYASPSNYVYEGSTVTLNVTARGALPLAYQWAKNGTNISGASVSSYLLTTKAVVADSGTYSVVITNNTANAVTSSVVLSVVGSPPLIFTQPASTGGFIDGPATFTVVDGGSLPRYYQWQHNATPVPGGTSATLTLPSVQWGDAGSYTCTISNIYGTTNTAAATLTVSGEFVGLTLPTTAPRDRHTALGSDGSYLYFTPGNTPSAEFYRIPQTALTGWTPRASLPTPSTINQDSGVGDLGYFGGALWCWGRDPGNSQSRVVYRYDIAGDTWTSGAVGSSDGPNSSCAVIATDNILGGWMGNNPVYQATDWANGVMAQLALLPGGAVHPWDSCIGPNAVYFIKHWNIAASNGVLASFTKTATPTVSYINGMPFNIGMGCAIEYMPGSLFGDGHDRLYILRGMTGTTDDDASETYGHWTTPTTAQQLATYDLATQTWAVQTLPFVIDVGSEMCLVNQTLYILAGNADPAPLKMLYLGPSLSPVVVNRPASQTVFAGQSATFSVGVLAGGPVNYQWRRGGAPINGATANYYTIPSAWYTDAASYDVVVSNGAGTNNSTSASLTVLYPPLFANLTNDLVLHLKFDGNFEDSSVRSNNATGNGPPPFVPGKLGQAASLSTVQASGIFNFVLVGTQPDFVFTETDSFSVSFWMNFTNWPNDLPMIGNAVGSTYQSGWVFAQDQNKIELSLVSPGGSSAYVFDPVAGSPIINDGLWHNMVGVVDRGSQTASVYVDGALAGSYSIVGLGTLDAGAALAIGQNPNGNYGYDGAGSFDDVGIWRRALSPTEVESIYMVAQQGTTFDTYGPVILSLSRAGNDIQLVWQAGTLQQSDKVNGTYLPVSGATAPYYRVTPGATPNFYRVRL